MINAMSVFTNTRIYLQDLDKTKFSDYQVLKAINDALFLLAREAEFFKPYFTVRKDITIPPEKLTVQTSDNLLEIKRLFDSNKKELLRVFSDRPGIGEYSWERDEVTFGEPGDYFAIILSVPQITELTDTIPVPDSYTVPIAKTAGSLLLNDNSSAIQFAQFFNMQNGSTPTKETKRGE